MPLVGEVSALLAAFFWASTSMLVTRVSSKIGIIPTNVGRMLISIGLFLVTIFAFQLPVQLSARQIAYLVVSAVIGLIFGDTCLFKGFQQIGARISMLIMSLAPAIAALQAYWFLGETLSLWGILGICATLGGISLVVFEQSAPGARPQASRKFSGVVWAFLGALGQGTGLIFAKFAFAEGPIHGVVAGFIRITAAVCLLLPSTMIQGHFRPACAKVFHDKSLALSLVLIAFFGVYLGITLSLVAITYAKVGVASTLIAMSPVMMLPMAKVFQHEALSWKAIFGALIAVAGVALLFHS